MTSELSETAWRRVESLAAARQENHGLPRALYSDADVYQAEIERIWRQGWLFAGHDCQIPEPGDYFVFDVDGDSILILRGDDGIARGFFNLCRHRGTILCESGAGRVGRIVCPYHQWTYGRDGQLVSCRGMQEGIEKNELGLTPVATQVVSGLIFVSLADNPSDFEPARRTLESAARPQGFDRAKVAKIVDYVIDANWKIVWENNRECYHCNVNHPQYIKANFDHYNADDASDRIKGEIERQTRASEEKWSTAGLAVTHKQAGMTLFPDVAGNVWYSANRTPLVDGYVSETMDGRQVAPLMGDYVEADVGTLRMRTLPNFWNHSSCDHAVSTRLAPAGPRQTHARVIWLVHQNAVEGRDYRFEEVMPFWQLTSEQDWKLCALVDRGVRSSGYRPGPLSTYKEYNLDRFLTWYVRSLRSGE